MNTFGHVFRITSFGESHGRGIGVVVDGCPAGLQLDRAAIQHELNRRRPGQNKITTQRKEPDQFELLSGTVDNITTGAPLAFMVWNQDQRSKDYDHIAQQFRPSHADYTYFAKYGIRDHRGGGRSSARETIARVIGGAVARQMLARACGMEFRAWVSQVGEIDYPGWPAAFILETEDQKMVRCPDPATSTAMVEAIKAARKAGDSLGGVVSARVASVPPGLGEPLYHKIDAVLASAMLSINATKGFEVGSGFAGTRMRGSTHNDAFYHDQDRVRTRTNHSGGIQGGISNGEDIRFRVAFKPTSTIMRDQESVDADGNSVVVKGKGRHDPCVVPRAVPIVEAMAALVLADMWLLHRGTRMP
ncbi:MAG: chorismate synthase [Bacteroidota bacterium]